MWKRTAVIGVLGVLVSVVPAAAQGAEVTGIFGWTLADGVDGQAIAAGNGQVYNRIDPTDSGSWGFQVGFFTTEQVELGFLFNQQLSSLEVGGTTTTEIGDMTINSYHGYFGYNFGEEDAKVRPYIMLGFGATSYGSVEFTALGAQRETSGGTQFSTTWGAGVKFYPNPKVLVRAGMQWTPTYIKSDAEGYWCDPWWGCYVVGDAQYSNQIQFSGGVGVRF
jgi:hypothetical protein